MIKQFAIALSVTTICANAHPAFALPKSEVVDREDRAGIKVQVKKMSPSERMKLRQRMRQDKKIDHKKRVEAAQKMRQEKRINLIEKMKARSKMRRAKTVAHIKKVLENQKARQAKRISFIERMKARSKTRQNKILFKEKILVQNKTIRSPEKETYVKNTINPIRNMRENIAKSKSFAAPLKLEQVSRVPVKKTLKDAILSQRLSRGPIAKKPLVLSLKSTKTLVDQGVNTKPFNSKPPFRPRVLAPKSTESHFQSPKPLTNLEQKVIRMEAPRVQNKQVEGRSLFVRSKHLADKSALFNPLVIGRRISNEETLKTAERPLKNIIDQAKEKAQLSTAVVVEKIAAIVPENFSQAPLSLQKISAFSREKVLHENPIQDIQRASVIVHEEGARENPIQDIQRASVIVHEEGARENPIQDIQRASVIVHEEGALENPIQDIQRASVIVHEEGALENPIQDIQRASVIVHEEGARENPIQDIQRASMIVHEEGARENPIQDIQRASVIVHEEGARENPIQDIQRASVIVHEEGARENPIQDIQAVSVIVHEEVVQENLIQNTPTEEKIVEDTPFQNVHTEEDGYTDEQTPNSFSHFDEDLFDTQVESLGMSLFNADMELSILKQRIKNSKFSNYFSPKHDLQELKTQQKAFENIVNTLENNKISFAALDAELDNAAGFDEVSLVQKAERLDNLKEFFNEITEQLGLIQHEIDFFDVQESTPTSMSTEEDGSSTKKEDTQPYAHVVALDLFHDNIIDADEKITSLKNTVERIKEESYNGHFPHYFDKNYAIPLQAQKGTIENLLQSSDDVTTILASSLYFLESNSGEFLPEDVRSATRAIEVLKADLDLIIYNLVRMSATIGSLPSLKTTGVTNTSISSSETENSQNMIDSGEDSRSIKPSTLSLSTAIMNSDDSIYNTHMLQSELINIVSNNNNNNNLLPIFEEKKEEKSNALSSSHSSSPTLEQAGSVVSQLLRIGNKLNDQNVKDFTDNLNTSAIFLNESLTGAMPSRKENVIEELQDLQSNIQIHQPSTEIANNDTTWIFAVHYWGNRILQTLGF